MMGGDKHNLLNFHLPLLHLPSHNGQGKREGAVLLPKGFMAIRVGKEGEEQQRFVVPVVYLNHPLFMRLLKEAEEEYGFDHKGAITIPCHVEVFRQVQGVIDRECAAAFHHHHHNHLLHLHLAGCFRA